MSELLSNPVPDENLRRLEFALLGSDQGLWDWNFSTGVVYFSDRWATMLGYQREELEPHVRTWEKLVHPDDLVHVQPLLEAHLEARTPLYEAEFRMLTRDRSWLWVLARGTVVERDSQGRPQRMVGIHLDITERRAVQERLRLFERAVHASPNGIVLADAKAPDFPLIYVNPAFENITGYSSAEVIGKNCRFLHAHEADQPALNVVRMALKEARPCQVVLHNQRKDGTLFVNEFSLAPVFDGEGHVTHFVGQQTDVSVRLKVESELTKMESKVVLAQKLAQLGYWSWSIDSGQIKWSPEVFTIFGRDPALQEPDFKELLNLHTLPSQRLLSEAVDQALRLGKPYHLDVEIVSGDTTRWVRAYGTGIQDAQGQAVELVGTVMDITDLKYTQQALHLREAEMRTMLDAMPDMLLRVNSKGLLQDCRPPSLVRQHLQSDDWAGHTVFDLFPSELGPSIREALDEVLKGSPVQVLEFQRPGVAAQEGPDYEVRFAALDQEQALAVVRDISEIKRAQRQLETARARAEDATRAKTEFLANMSHEIRTPMNGVIGMTSLLSQSSLEPQQAEYVEIIRSSGETLLTLINEILDFSKIEAGRIDLEDQVFSVSQCLEESLDLIGVAAKDKGLRLIWTVEPSVPAFVNGDVTRLRQILVNLLSNAVKFTSEGSIDVSLSAVPEEGQEGRVRLRCVVRDSGIGVPPGLLDRLFEPFTQADSSTTRKFGGTGLGLSICRRLCQRMGGEITAESQVGQGATFTFEVSLGRAESPPVALRVETLPENMALAEVHPLRILLVEDNFVNQRVAQLLLSRLGYQCDVATDGHEAVASLRRQDYQLVLMDVQMPEMDGLEVTRFVRKELQGKQPYIVALTANARAQDREEALRAGMDDFLTKPLRAAELREALEKAALAISAQD